MRLKSNGYDINQMYAEFFVIGDIVLRLTLFTDWYGDPVDIGVNLDSDLISAFGISESAIDHIVEDTNTALKYQNFSKDVYEFYVLEELGGDKISMIRVT